MKLPESAGLRTLVSKHGAQVKVFLRDRFGGAIMFDKGAHSAGGPLRTQGQRGAVAVRKSIHFLFDDIGCGADASSEERCGLENR